MSVSSDRRSRLILELMPWRDEPELAFELDFLRGLLAVFPWGTFVLLQHPGFGGYIGGLDRGVVRKPQAPSGVFEGHRQLASRDRPLPRRLDRLEHDAAVFEEHIRPDASMGSALEVESPAYPWPRLRTSVDGIHTFGVAVLS